MKLTQKDKILIKWLFLFLSFYLVFQFVYTPIQTNLSTKESELDALIAQKEYTEITLPTYENVLNNERDTRSLLAGRFNHFFEEFEPETIEAFLEPIFIKYNAQINYFQASITQIVVPEVLVDEKEILNYKIKLLIDEYEKNSTELDTPLIATSDLLRTRVTYRIDISFANYQLLIQVLSELDTSVILINSSYIFEDGIATLDFDVYSLQKFSENK